MTILNKNEKEVEVNDEVSSEKPIKKTKKFSLKKFIIRLLFVIAILGIWGTFYYHHKYNELKTNPTMEAEKETKKMVKEVGKLMQLPDETPTIVTVSDKEKLKDQSFFDNAENGDVVLAYTQKMIAILYRPSTEKIINVAPITVDQNQQTYKEQTTEIPNDTE